MKNSFAFAALSAAFTQVLLLNAADPGKPEDNGLLPVSETFYVNTPDTLNNGGTESLGVGIAQNGNVLIGWEDDGDELADLEAVWTLYGPDGTHLTPETTITTIDPAFTGQTLKSRFLSYFRTDGSAVSGRTSWGPKIKANLFGNGLGMGATSFELANEVVELAAIQNDALGENAGDYPSIQLLGNGGEPMGVVVGVTDAYAERPGDIRIADWDYLSTGNVVIVGESRQRQDLVEIYGGANGEQTHAIVRVVSPTGTEVAAIELASEVPDKAEMWHGVGVTKNGFGVRFANELGRATVRLFDNLGQPTSTNIDLATVAGSEVMAAGGRGDSVGFHGNGKDGYVAVARIGANAADETPGEVWVTVLNADGSLRWSRSVADDVALQNPPSALGSCDAAMDSLGRVVVVYSDVAGTGGNAEIVMGRVIGAKGEPLGGTFYVSEKELPVAETFAASGPRVAFRGNSVAVIWESLNGGTAEAAAVAGRLFSVNARGGLDSVGLARIVPDQVIYNTGADNLENWEPYVSVVGTSTFLVEANTFAENDASSQRFALALQPAIGGNFALGDAFFADNGTPFRGAINASRQDGNPGRVTGDRRPGAVNFMTGAEASPHTLAAFKSDNRWNLGFERPDDNRYGSVQTFQLDPATLVQSPLSKAFDSANGRLSSGISDSSQATRFGGHMVALDNGNFAVVVEDRSKVRNPDGNAAVATIIAPNGSIVKESFVVSNGDLWANVAAFKGGFAVRVGGIIYFFDNSGTELGTVDQDASGLTFDRGRGDDTRLGGHINTPFVYLVGTVEGTIRLAVFDARDRSFVTETAVALPEEEATFARADVDGDALGRVVVVYEQKPAEWEKNQVLVRVYALDATAKVLNPLTPSFFPFINYSPAGIGTTTPAVAVTTRQILVAAKGEINSQNKPELGPDTPARTTFYTVFAHPDPQDDPTPAVPGQTIAAAATINGNNLVVTWTGGTAPFKVQQRASLSTGNWTDVTTTSDRTANVPITGETGFVQVVGQ